MWRDGRRVPERPPGRVDPVLALRRLSMAAAGTDLAAYRSFLEQGERHRYAHDRDPRSN